MAAGEMLDASLELPVDAGVSEVDDSAVDSGSKVEVSESSEQETTEQVEGESSESTEGKEDQEQSGKETGKEQVDGKGGAVLPKTITHAIKTLTESGDPELKSAAKVLRESYFSKLAYEKEFGGSVKAARTFLADVAGTPGKPTTLAQAQESWNQQRGLVENIRQSDELVHSGDPQIWQNIIEDLRDEGNLDNALPKLVSGGLDSLKNYSREAYEETFAPHFMEALDSVNLGPAIDALERYIGVVERTNGKDGWAGLTKVVGELKGWFTDLKSQNSKQAIETRKLDQERAAFVKQQTEGKEKEAKQFKESVATECDSYSNKALGSALKPFLKMPFFKGFPRETLVDLGNGIKERLYQVLGSDSTYQSQMKGQWGQKSPDKGKIVEFHKTKLDAIAQEIVEKTIKQRYPGFAKGGSAAGRVAAAKEKSEANTKASAQSVATSRPIYVATKPSDLVRNAVTVGGKHYTSADLEMMLITGKGFVKNTNGTFKLVTWRR